MTSRERIAVVTTSYPEHDQDPSGHFVRTEVDALRTEGHSVTVFVPRGDAFGWPGLVSRISERPHRIATASRALWQVRRVLSAGACVEPWDRIIAHWLPTAALGFGVAGPLEVVAHGTDVRLLAKMPASMRAVCVGALVRRATRVRVVSEPLAELLRECAAPATRAQLVSKMVVAASAIEPARPSTRSRSYRARYPRQTTLAVAVARLVREKEVARALAHVSVARQPTSLVVVGDGPERPALERLARELSIDAQFVGLVPREEALAWIGAADVLLQPSRAEGCSTVEREARALGTRVELL